MRKYRSEQFYWNAETKSFSQELSTLQATSGEEQLIEPYGDPPKGFDLRMFKMVSSKTGTEATFREFDREWNNDDLVAWIAIPTQPTLKKHPALRGVKVVIFND